MESERPDHPARWRLMAAGALGLGLILLAVPMTVSGIAADLARGVLRRTHEPALPGPAELRSAADRLALAARFGGGGQAAADQGRLLLLEALTLPAGPGRTALLARSEQVTADSLARSPAQPGTWLRLAALRQWRGDLPGAVEAFKLSVMTGPVAPALMASRLDLGLAMLGSLDADGLNLLRRQARLTATIMPEHVQALRSGPHAGFIAGALAGGDDTNGPEG